VFGCTVQTSTGKPTGVIGLVMGADLRDCRIPCWSANKCSSSWRDCRCEQMFGERLFGGGYGSRYDTRYEQMFGIFCPYFARVVSGTSKVGQGEARGARGARQGEGERQGERARRERQGKARRGQEGGAGKRG
jgi:hypothetical protein